MKLAVIGFTPNGLKLEKRLRPVLEEAGHQVQFFIKSKYIEPKETEGEAAIVSESLKEWAEKWIPREDGILFVGAAGIAVRTMVPFVESKRTDPAVLVLDEKGQFVISLLSGHLGGANELANVIAEKIGAIPVITTATDVNQKFAVDVFAKNNELWISDMRLAKEVSARILRGERLKAGAGAGYCEGSHAKPYKELLFEKKDSPDGVRGTFWIQIEEGQILHLIPKNKILGVGCRKGTSMEHIERIVKEVLEENKILPLGIRKMTSIDLKKEEPGLTEFSQKWNLPFETFTSEQLQKAEGDFSASVFVSKITGVDNVCERSAILGSIGGVLLIKKQVRDGVTIACAQEEWSVEFE